MEAILNPDARAVAESDLVERFRSGDAAAFDEIVTLHRVVVYGVARRLLRSHEDADEAAQTAFVKAWTARRSFRGDAGLRTWLVRIALNTAKSMLAARREAPAVEPDAERAGGADPLLQVEEAERNAALLDALEGRARVVDAGTQNTMHHFASLVDRLDPPGVDPVAA